MIEIHTSSYEAVGLFAEVYCIYVIIFQSSLKELKAQRHLELEELWNILEMQSFVDTINIKQSIARIMKYDHAKMRHYLH